MITIELLTKFIHEKLRYKKNIKVVSYQIFEKFIYISFDSFGETVNLKHYYDWYSEIVQKNREEKLKDIIWN
jgi:hypothetical protein